MAIFEHASSARPSRHRRVTARLALGFSLLVGGLFPLAGRAEGAARREADDFSPLVKLAPLVVHGEQLSISIHARSDRDRRYAADFAEDVITVVYESVTKETGRGLVIIGKKGEPHPIFVFRKFLALAKDGKLDPAVAERGPELTTMLRRWQDTVDEKPSGRIGDGEVDAEFDQIVTALPLPLEGIGAKLYQLAWAEKFDEAKVEARMRMLRAGDLERRDLFAHFDWVFYLPPKGAFDRVLDELIADALKEEDTGFFARAMVKGALLVVRPKIREAIEAVRHGLLFMAVVQARTRYSEDEVSSLTGAYIEALMPGEKHGSGPAHGRAVRAIREQQRRNEEAAKPRAASAGEGYGTSPQQTASPSEIVAGESPSNSP